MSFQMATPWNAVVASTKRIAEQYMEAFGLSPEMWEARTLSENTASTYERIVLIRPHWRLTAGQITDFENEVIRWSLRRSPSGKFKIL